MHAALTLSVISIFAPHLQGSAYRQIPGFTNFVRAVAYHFCLGLAAAFTQPGTRLLAKPCTINRSDCGLPLLSAIGIEFPRRAVHFWAVMCEIRADSVSYVMAVIFSVALRD